MVCRPAVQCHGVVRCGRRAAPCRVPCGGAPRGDERRAPRHHDYVRAVQRRRGCAPRVPAAPRDAARPWGRRLRLPRGGRHGGGTARRVAADSNDVAGATDCIDRDRVDRRRLRGRAAGGPFGCGDGRDARRACHRAGCRDHRGLRPTESTSPGLQGWHPQETRRQYGGTTDPLNAKGRRFDPAPDHKHPLTSGNASSGIAVRRLLKAHSAYRAFFNWPSLVLVNAVDPRWSRP